MLTDVLTEDVVKLDVEGVRTPEEVIGCCGELLKKAGKINETYIEKMISAYRELGPYIVMAPGIAMPHARPSGDVLEPCISFIRLKEPMVFGHPCNDPVKLVFALGGVESDSHLDILKELGSFLEEENRRNKLLTIKTYGELLNLMKEEKG